MFALYPKVIEPRSSLALEEIGHENLKLSKKYGLNYDKVVQSTGMKRVGVKNKTNTFCSFEDHINMQYSDLKVSEPASRDSRRAGVLGYKIGMTHFWDKWGAMVGCTVV